MSKRAVVDLRAFFEDLAVWGWADRPPGPLLFAADVPRLDRPLPRALPPGVDRDLMAAVAGLRRRPRRPPGPRRSPAASDPAPTSTPGQP